jgi:hypothetical protein
MEPIREGRCKRSCLGRSGKRCRVEGTPADGERVILDAARGAITEFAWLDDADTGERIGINPECVVLLRGSGP